MGVVEQSEEEEVAADEAGRVRERSREGEESVGGKISVEERGWELRDFGGREG